MNGGHTAINTFTQTLGTSNSEIVKTLEVEFPKDFEGIKSFNEFIRKYTKKDGKLNGHYKKWLSFLSNLHTDLVGNYSNKVDPIEFIYFLYNQEGLSINDIHRRLKSFGDYKDEDTLRRFLKNILGWDLRDSNDRTDINKRKAKSSKDISGLKKSNDKKSSEAKENFRLRVSQILSGEILEKTFSLEIYNSLKSKKEKSIYLISIILGVEQDQVIEKIKILKKSFGYKSIAYGLGEKSFEKGINIILTKDDIRNLLVITK